MKSSYIDIDEIFARGGKPLIGFLDYCIRSIQMDPLFIFLVQEYRNSPTVPKAVALFDIFCAPQGPGRTSAVKALPPYDVRLREMVRQLQSNLLPPKYLFDGVVAELKSSSVSLPKIRRRYKPHRTLLQNLPGGKMTAGQRHFVDRVWQPVIRPVLTAAGFWRIATIA